MGELRFCFFTTFYPPYNFGGDGIAVERLARALIARGCAVTVVHDVDAFRVLNHGPEPEAARKESGLDIVGLRASAGRLSLVLTHQTGRPVVHGRRIKQLLRDGNFDALVFHNVSLVGGPGLLSYGGNIPKIYLAHEHWLVCPTHVLWRHGRERCDGRQCVRCSIKQHRPPQPWRWTGYLERQIAHVDAVIAMSEFSREKHREFGFSRAMEVLPLFLPDPTPEEATSIIAASPHPRPYFLFAGRLERIKGLDDVIPVFRQFQRADLLIAGDGDYGDTLRALAAGIRNVHFLGRVSPEALRQYYEHALALVVPSLCFETFGIVLIEAFRQRTPVIARRLGPFPEIVAESQAGELFETPEDLIAAMRRVQDDPAHRARLATNGYRAYLERWSESAVVPRFLDIVRRAAERRGNARTVTLLDSLMTPKEVATRLP